MTDVTHTRKLRKISKIGVAAILIPGLAACILLAISASIASSVEGHFDYMSEGPGAVNVLDQASLLFSIASGLLIATIPGIALLASAHERPRIKFVFVLVVTVLVAAFATYFVSWMLSRP